VTPIDAAWRVLKQESVVCDECLTAVYDSYMTTRRFSKRMEDGTYKKVCWYCAHRKGVKSDGGVEMYAPNCTCDNGADGELQMRIAQEAGDHLPDHLCDEIESGGEYPCSCACKQAEKQRLREQPQPEPEPEQDEWNDPNRNWGE